MEGASLKSRFIQSCYDATVLQGITALGSTPASPIGTAVPPTAPIAGGAARGAALLGTAPTGTATP